MDCLDFEPNSLPECAGKILGNMYMYDNVSLNEGAIKVFDLDGNYIGEATISDLTIKIDK